MEAIKQIIRIPKNHEVKIKVPEHIPTDEEAEVVLFIRKKSEVFKKKIEALKSSKTDKIFLEDLRNTLNEFNAVDLEGL